MNYGFGGCDLRSLRLLCRRTQSCVAAAAGVHVDTVRYWERKKELDLQNKSVRALLKSLGAQSLYRAADARRQKAIGTAYATSTRGRAHARLGVLAEAQSEFTAGGRTVCGAKTRRGTPCVAKAVRGKKRCRIHGGLSTGPRTKEGRARISKAQRRRWQKDGE